MGSGWGAVGAEVLALAQPRHGKRLVVEPQAAIFVQDVGSDVEMASRALHLFQQLIVDLNTRSQFSVESEFYLCGPKEMMAEVSNILLLCNIPQDRIFTDEFSYD